MSQATPAPTILEFLTHPNPRVEHRKPKDKTNTKSFNYYFPRQLRHWDEFDVGLLETIYGGSLLEAARRTGRVLPHYPTTSPLTDLVISGEKSVERLISKWNETIVTAALEPILNDFRPAVWSPGEGPNETEKFDKPPRRRGSRTQPIRKTPSLAGLTPTARKKQSLSRLRPDSGSSAARYIPDPSLKTANDRTSMDRRERFPKEYKVATKWRSSQVLEGGLLNEEGEWEAGQFSDNLARPINQAFTYCVANRARYGCILTCEEAFIFRIKPRALSTETSKPAKDMDIVQELIDDGLMEYISVPWSSAWDSEALPNEHTWTINLALWFVHILAGNHFEAAREYSSLNSETLINNAPILPAPYPQERIGASTSNIMPVLEDAAAQVQGGEEDSDSSTDTIPVESSPFLRKRKIELLARDEEEDEGPYLSFSKRPFVALSE